MVAVYLILFAALFSSVLGDSTGEEQQLLEAQLKLAQLESRYSEILQNVEARQLFPEEKKKQIEDVEVELLEEEARFLWAKSRKNNFDLHVLESKAREAEDRVQELASQVDKMAEIVAEQWMQVQHFEQALLHAHMRASMAQRNMRLPRCRFLKLVDNLSVKYLPKAVGLWPFHLFGKGFALDFKMPHDSSQLLKRFCSTTKRIHHELQGVVKREMEKHQFTACLANEELVFFLASALFILPLLSAWALLSSLLARRR